MDWRLALAGLQLQLEGLRQAGWRNAGGLSPPRPPMMPGPSLNSLQSISAHQPWSAYSSGILPLLQHQLPPLSASALGLTSNQALQHDGTAVTGAFQLKTSPSVQAPTVGPMSTESINWREQLDHCKSTGLSMHKALPPVCLPVSEGDLLSPTSKKQGRWCAMHVRIAWEIHLTRQQQRKDEMTGARPGVPGVRRHADGNDTQRRLFSIDPSHLDSRGSATSTGTSGRSATAHVDKCRSTTAETIKDVGVISSALGSNNHVLQSLGGLLPFSDSFPSGPVPRPPSTRHALHSAVTDMTNCLVGGHCDSEADGPAAAFSSLKSPVVSLLSGWNGTVADSQNILVCPKDVNRKRKLSEDLTAPSPQHIVDLPSDNIGHATTMMPSSIASSSTTTSHSSHTSPLSPSLTGPDSTVSTSDTHVTLATSSSDDQVTLVALPLSDIRGRVQRRGSINRDLDTIQSSTQLDHEVRVDTPSDSTTDQHYPPRQLWNPFLQSITTTSVTSRQHQEVDTGKNNGESDERSSVKLATHLQNDHLQSATVKMKSTKKRQLVSVNRSQAQIVNRREVVAGRPTDDEVFQTPLSPDGAVVRSQSPSSSTIDTSLTSTMMLSEASAGDVLLTATADTQLAKLTRPPNTCTPDSSSTFDGDDNVTKDSSLDPISTIGLSETSDCSSKSTVTIVATVT